MADGNKPLPTLNSEEPYSFSLFGENKLLTDYGDGTHLFGANSGVDIKNTYDRTLHVAACLFNTFFARLPKVDAGPDHTLEIQAPPSAIQIPEMGSVTWELIKSHAFESILGTDRPFIKRSRYYSPEADIFTGNCTGDISPGDTKSYPEYYFIRASPMDMVGFSVDLDIEGVGWRWKSYGALLSTPKFPNRP